MNRLGWAILLGIVLMVAGFLSMLSFERSPTKPHSAAPPAPRDERLLVPVEGVAQSSLVDQWGDPREGGARTHHGLDIAAPRATPVVATAAGIVEKLFESERGGTTLYLRSPDRRWTYYYAHLGGYAPGIHEGLRVVPGARLGYVGDTGDAGAGNYHLHFSITRTTPEKKWYEGEDVDPYPLLVERGGGG